MNIPPLDTPFACRQLIHDAVQELESFSWELSKAEGEFAGLERRLEKLTHDAMRELKGVQGLTVAEREAVAAGKVEDAQPGIHASLEKAETTRAKHRSRNRDLTTFITAAQSSLRSHGEEASFQRFSGGGS